MRYHKFIVLIISLCMLSPAFALASDSPKDIVEKQCSKCHPTSIVYDAKKSQDEWEKTVDRMITYGTNLSKEEREAVIQYLLKRK
jgi:hypothetical protein